MNLYTKYSAFVLAAAIGCASLVGCIRDDNGPCPPLSVKFGIKDRVYDNAASVEYTDPNAGATAFSDIIPQVYCVLRDGNGAVVREQRLTGSNGSQVSDPIIFDEALPFGKYNLIAWGALDSESRLGDDPATLDIYGLNSDVYITSADIDYQYDKATVEADFMRATGLVILKTVWLAPAGSVDELEMSITGLSSEVDKDLSYSKLQNVKITNKCGLASTESTYAIMPPSDADYASVMHVHYYNSANPGLVDLVPDDVNFTVKRNNVVVIKHEIEPYSKSIKISTLVDGRWQQINGMSVD